MATPPREKWVFPLRAFEPVIKSIQDFLREDFFTLRESDGEGDNAVGILGLARVTGEQEILRKVPFCHSEPEIKRLSLMDFSE
jgi:hypothetical protein